jgi:hypothetical protein
VRLYAHFPSVPLKTRVFVWVKGLGKIEHWVVDLVGTWVRVGLTRGKCHFLDKTKERVDKSSAKARAFHSSARPTSEAACSHRPSSIAMAAMKAVMYLKSSILMLSFGACMLDSGSKVLYAAQGV